MKIYSRSLQRLLSPGKLVLVLVVLGILAVWGLGPKWLYLVLASPLVLLLGVANPRLDRLALSLLASCSAPLEWALSYERRRREILRVGRGIDLTLKYFNHSPSEKVGLEGLAAGAASQGEDYLDACCRCFAETIYGRDHPMLEPLAEVIELLYLDFHDLNSAILWRRTSKEQRWALARILAASGRLPELEEGERMIDLVAWVLERVHRAPGSDFRRKSVEEELASLYRVWIHLSGFAGYLAAMGITAKPDVDDLRSAVDKRVSEGLLTSNFATVGEAILVGASTRWMLEWAKTVGLKEPDARTLALVGLGIFSSSSELAVLGKPLLEPLGCQVARNTEALNMLLAYLWNRSRPQPGAVFTPGLGDLARNWEKWFAEAKAGMSVGVMNGMYAVLQSDLQRGVWPTWLPIERTIAVVQQSQKNHELLEELLQAENKNAAEWRQQMQDILAWAGGAVKSLQQLSPDELGRVVKAAFEEKLRQLALPKQGAAPLTVEFLKKELEGLAVQLGPRLSGYPDSAGPSVDVPASFRRRVADLGHRLEDLTELLLAEAVGGKREYLITFDQSRGRLAKVIDTLKDRYGFEHYTRYSRIGELRQGEMFQDFYRRFRIDLEKQLVNAIIDDPSNQWEQIEVTVQQICVSRRHDFVVDAGPDLKADLTEAVFAQSFRVPPAPEVLPTAA